MTRWKAWGLAALTCFAMGSQALAFEAPVGRAWTRAYYLDDTAAGFLRFWDDTASESSPARVTQFRERFAPSHAEALALTIASQQDAPTFYRKTLPAFFATLDAEHLEEVRRTTREAERAVPRLANRLQTCFATGSLRLDRPFVLGLGFGASASVVAPYRGRNTLMIPADGLVGETLDIRLAADMYRLLRADVRQENHWSEPTTLGMLAFEEGAARRFAYEQIPGFGVRETLGYTPQEWAFALSQQHGLALAVLRHSETESGPFLDMYGPEAAPGKGRPPRVGTFVGYLVLDRLRRLHDWDEIIRWDPETAAERVRATLATL